MRTSRPRTRARGRPPGRHPGVEIGRVRRANLEQVRAVQSQQQLDLLISGHAAVARPPQFFPGCVVAVERRREVTVAGRRPGRLDQRVADRRVSRRVEGDHLLDPRRLALAHVEGQDLLDVVLHLVERPAGRQRLAAAEDARAGRLADVEIRLPGLGLQRDDLRTGRPRRNGVQMTSFEFPVAGHAVVTHPAIERGDDLDLPRPVARDEGPLDTGVMLIGHADEPAAGQRRLPAGAVTKAEVPKDGRVPDVIFVAVGKQLDVIDRHRFLAFDAQLEDQPVRQVDEILVQDRQAAHHRGLAVVAAVRVGARVVHAVGVCPLGRAARAQVPVASGGQRLPKSLCGWVETIINEQETIHKASALPFMRLADKVQSRKSRGSAVPFPVA